MNDQMTLSPHGEEMVKSWEDGGETKFPFKAYDDKTGTWTGPFGITRGVKRGQVFTEEQAQQLFDKEVAGCVDAVHRLIKVPLSQGEFDALVSFFYNNGWNKCQTLINTINAGDLSRVPSVWMMYVNAYNERTGRREPWPGLVDRRRKELALWNEVSTDKTTWLPNSPAEPPQPRAALATAASSKTVWSLLTAAGAAVANWFDDLFSKSNDIHTDVSGVQSLLEIANFNHKGILTSLIVVAICAAVIRHTILKRSA